MMTYYAKFAVTVACAVNLNSKMFMQAASPYTINRQYTAWPKK